MTATTAISQHQSVLPVAGEFPTKHGKLAVDSSISRREKKGPRASTIIYRISAAITLLVVIAHETIVADQALADLDALALDEETKWLYHWSWHIDIVAVVGMAAMFIVGSRVQAGKWLTAAAVSLATGYALVSVGLAIFGNAIVWQSPTPYAWGSLALFSGVGLYLDNRPYNVASSEAVGDAARVALLISERDG